MTPIGIVNLKSLLFKEPRQFRLCSRHSHLIFSQQVVHVQKYFGSKAHFGVFFDFAFLASKRDVSTSRLFF